MLSRLLTFGIFAIAAHAQESSSSSSSSTSKSSSTSDAGVSVLTGASELSDPTGSYLSYASTLTIPSTTTSASAISTSAIISTEISGSSTIITTLGSTTIFAVGTSIVSNGSTTTPISSQVLLSAPSRSTTSGNLNITTPSSSSAFPSATCNNYPEFCNRTYGNITEVSAHNSPFITKNNAASNQALDVTTQLNDGIRLLQGQMHFNGSTPHFCHTSCNVLDAGPITDYLDTVYNWVSTHPFDVVTILLENGDYRPVTDFVPFLEQTGLVQYAYVPPQIPMAITDWPVLSEFILSGKRVLFFMDYEANQTAVPYVMDEFSQMWETPFDPTNRSFPCTIQRPPPLLPKDAVNRLYLTNHNLNYDINILGNSLLVPNIPLLNVTNNITGFGSLGEGAETCFNEWNYAPKFLNVDYYNVGNGSVFEVAAKYNNVTYNRPCCGIPVSGSSELKVAGRGAILAAFAVVTVTWMLL